MATAADYRKWAEECFEWARARLCHGAHGLRRLRDGWVNLVGSNSATSRLSIAGARRRAARSHVLPSRLWYGFHDHLVAGRIIRAIP
jgi:hypothetical protein